MFENSVGQVFYKDSCLSILITNLLDKNDLHDFLYQFTQIYTSIDEPFSIISDLSRVSIFSLSSTIYYPIIKIFTENYSISENYLTKIEMILTNSIIIKILNNFFYLYQMPHPVKFIKKNRCPTNKLPRLDRETLCR